MTQPSGAKAVLSVVSGNFLEMYDFMVFGFYAHEIGQAYFPSQNVYASLMLSFATFGAGFLARPLGALWLGPYIDRYGRRRGLILTLGLMAIGIALIALTPSYANIGPLAPLLMLCGRLLQGFSAGVELGGVSVYLAEIAPPGRQGFYVSWQSASQQLAVLFAASLGLLLQQLFNSQQLHSWAWRLPFFIGCLVVPVLLLMRRHLQETPHSANRGPSPSRATILRSVHQHAGLMLAGMGMVALTTVAFYLISAYMPTFGRDVLHLGVARSLGITACIAISNFIWLPIMGACSDRIGRRPLLISSALLMLISIWPVLHWVTTAPSFWRLWLAGEWMSLLYSSYNGAMVVALVEWMPSEVRTTGFSLAYSLATASFGGFTPLICTGLIHHSGDRAAPGIWLALAAACSLLAISSLGRYRAATLPPPHHSAH